MIDPKKERGTPEMLGLPLIVTQNNELFAVFEYLLNTEVFNNLWRFDHIKLILDNEEENIEVLRTILSSPVVTS